MYICGKNRRKRRFFNHFAQTVSPLILIVKQFVFAPSKNNRKSENKMTKKDEQRQERTTFTEQ